MTGKPTDPRSMNRFLYAEANPWTFSDPSGHATCYSSSDLCDETMAIRHQGTQAAKDAVRRMRSRVNMHYSYVRRLHEKSRRIDPPEATAETVPADEGWGENAKIAEASAEQQAAVANSGGISAGWCVNGSINVGLHAGGSACFASDWYGNGGLILTPSVLTQGSTTVGAVVTTGPMVSNARTLHDFDGWFANIGGSVARGPAVSGDLSVGKAPDGYPVWVANGGYGTGFETSMDDFKGPYEGHGGAVPSFVLQQPGGGALPVPFNSIQTGLQLLHWAASGGSYNPWQP